MRNEYRAIEIAGLAHVAKLLSEQLILRNKGNGQIKKTVNNNSS